jgi:hypothetical protein
MARKNTHLRVGLPRFVIAVPVFHSQFLRTPRRPVRSAPAPHAARSRIAARKKRVEGAQSPITTLATAATK